MLDHQLVVKNTVKGVGDDGYIQPVLTITHIQNNPCEKGPIVKSAVFTGVHDSPHELATAFLSFICDGNDQMYTGKEFSAVANVICDIHQRQRKEVEKGKYFQNLWFSDPHKNTTEHGGYVRKSLNGDGYHATMDESNQGFFLYEETYQDLLRGEKVEMHN